VKSSGGCSISSPRVTLRLGGFHRQIFPRRISRSRGRESCARRGYMEDRENDWLLKPLPQPEKGRYYLECGWCYRRDTGFNWKCTSPAMFVDVNDPAIYPLPPYMCDRCRRIRGSKSVSHLVVYSEYLRTDHWQGVKYLALRRSGHKCQLCGSRKLLQVHHNSYIRLWHEWPEDVIVLCDPCHAKYHYKGDKTVEEVCDQMA